MKNDSKLKSYQEMKERYPNLFSPITIKGHTFRNRIVAAPNGGGPNLFMATNDGLSGFTETAALYYAQAAKGGAAVVNTGHLGVDMRYTLGSNKERFDFFSDNIHHHVLPVLHMMTDLIHSYGAKASIELNHPGYRGTSVYGDKLMGTIDEVLSDGREVKGMDLNDMEEVAEYYANAALIGKRGGFDLINIHAGHGWLLSNFISPLTNKRVDDYGGSAENRAKFPLMVLKRIREAIGEEMLITFRFSVSDAADGGINMEDSIAIIKMFEEYADIVHCSAGSVNDFLSMAFMFSNPHLKPGCDAYLAELVKKNVSIPVETVSGINNPELAEMYIASGMADLVATARSFIADEDWAIKAREGRPEDIRPCIKCLRCLEYATNHSGTSECTVNPKRVLPREMPKSEIAFQKKKVVVVGGGAAGMNTANELGLKGHEVILFEARNELGGVLDYADYMSNKRDIRRYREYLKTQVQKNENVMIKLGQKVTADMITKENADSVVLAIGAKPFIPEIKGVEANHVMHSSAMFGNEDKIGRKVVVIGGGNVGCEITSYLKTLGKSVDIVEIEDRLIPNPGVMEMERGFTLFFMNREYNDDMKTYSDTRISDKVSIYTGSRCLEILEKGVLIEKDGKQLLLEADSIIMATGLRKDTATLSEFNDTAIEVIRVGDCLKVGDLHNASSTSYGAALQI
jgi:2,4-dienoyl-CoA reductase-like NADH-dependent reductase (Old Yellow Enzyme family)/thioredoxin reductase